MEQYDDTIENRENNFDIDDYNSEFQDWDSNGSYDEIASFIDPNITPEQLPDAVKKQTQIMVELSDKIEEANSKMIAAKQKASEAKHKVSLFKKRKAIEELQDALTFQSDALASEGSAMRLLFSNQKQLANISQGLLVLGLVNIVQNRTVFQRYKDELEKASKETINENAKKELKRILDQLKAQEDIYYRIEANAKKTNDLKEEVDRLKSQSDDIRTEIKNTLYTQIEDLKVQISNIPILSHYENKKTAPLPPVEVIDSSDKHRHIDKSFNKNIIYIKIISIIALFIAIVAFIKAFAI